MIEKGNLASKNDVCSTNTKNDIIGVDNDDENDDNDDDSENEIDKWN